MSNGTGAVFYVLFALLLLAGCERSAQRDTAAQPDDKTVVTQALELGATVMQSTAALDPFNIYLVGFHPMKADPHHQMEAHHICHQVNEDFAQCVLFDDNSAGARLNGIEYIISERLFDNLPEEERPFWHPHNYEILSGQLVAPGLPQTAEKELMKRKINSYGKTWHMWDTTASDTASRPDLPLGEPWLAWSFNHDGEARPDLIERRDRNLEINTHERREQRQNLIPLARPQEGVDALWNAFPQPIQAIPGVTNKEGNENKEQLKRQPNQQPSS